MGTLNSGEVALLRVSEVARIIGFGRSKTYEMIRAGEIPSLDIDGNIRVPRSSLQAWLENKINSAANLRPPNRTRSDDTATGESISDMNIRKHSKNT
jgi:excisionase family DNA binding protein